MVDRTNGDIDHRLEAGSPALMDKECLPSPSNHCPLKTPPGIPRSAGPRGCTGSVIRLPDAARVPKPGLTLENRKPKHPVSPCSRPPPNYKNLPTKKAGSLDALDDAHRFSWRMLNCASFPHWDRYDSERDVTSILHNTRGLGNCAAIGSHRSCPRASKIESRQTFLRFSEKAHP